MVPPQPINPSNTALLLIEYQNDFASPGGSLHDPVAPVMESTAMLEHSQCAMTDARNAGVTVIHAPLAFEPGYEEIGATPYGILKGVVETNAFERDTWGVELVDSMKPDPVDIVLAGKRGLDAFGTTNLDFELRSRNIETIAIAGFLTNCCIESTMRSGYELGYRIVPLIDCMAATSIEEHTMAITHNFPRFSNPMEHKTFLEAIGVGAATSSEVVA